MFKLTFCTISSQVFVYFCICSCLDLIKLHLGSSTLAFSGLYYTALQEKYENKCLHKWKILPVQTHMTLSTMKHKDEGWEDVNCNCWSTNSHINYHNNSSNHLCALFQGFWSHVTTLCEKQAAIQTSIHTKSCVQKVHTQLYIRTRRCRRNALLASSTNEGGLRTRCHIYNTDFENPC